MEKAILFLTGLIFFTMLNQSYSQNEKSDELETDAMSQLVLTGFGSNNNFGFSVANAGDVNGDGFEDVISGAYGYNSGQGRAYIYFGGTGMNAAADVTMTGELTGNNFGYSVASAGDVNGDGYDDVIVGAYGYNSSTGRTYIYFGGAVMNNVADVTLTGGATNNNFGISVSKAGDVNGDGYSDVIIGANGYNTFSGRAYIYFGGSGMNNIADVTLISTTVNIQFGRSVSNAGDVNGDSYDDVIVGASGYNTSTGRAYIYYGGSSMNNTADVTFTGEAVNNQFGFSVSSAEDINGDGFYDVIVGAYNYNTNVGRAYIYYGGSPMNNSADVIMTGESAGSQFGISVTGLGDFNGDSYGDVLVGANTFSSDKGKAYLFFGGTSMNNTADEKFNGETASEQFGRAVSSAGDVNGDGYKDLVIGAFANNNNTGKAYVYQNKLTGVDIHDLKAFGENSNTFFGTSVADAGDVNGDGYSDFIVGSYNSNKAYIFFGGTNMDNVADVVFTGNGGRFGNTVAKAGDVNGDGFADVMVGAFRDAFDSGRVYVYFGGSPMNTIPDVIVTGYEASMKLGDVISGAGDYNGDGFMDIIICSMTYNSTTGIAYLYFGGSAMDNVPDVLMNGESMGVGLGYSASGIGDVNGDGLDDILISAANYDTDKGRAYIYSGKQNYTGNDQPSFKTSADIGGGFGTRVSKAGDVNGDGYSDFMISSPYASNNFGKVYLYYGGIALDTIPDIVFNGEQQFSYFGLSISSAGDVNNDGYSDVIFGSPNYGSNVGRSYIAFGGRSMDNAFEIILNGRSATEQFGNSVSGGGDANGDGLSDVICGAYMNFEAGNFFGAAYFYFSSAPAAVPSLISVKDIPNDQGGKVQLKWNRSSYDVQGINRITNYIVERSNPPSGGNYYWETVATINASNNPYYSYTALTPVDSTSNSPGTFYFRVTAHTSNPAEYWRSNTAFGRSIDNISPLYVQGFTSMLSGGDVNLSWKKNTETDLYNYLIFRNTSQTINPDTEAPYAVVTDTMFTDNNPMPGNYYYFISAQDIHNNKSPVVSSDGPNITVNLTALIEGFYNQSTNLHVSDTIKSYLRNSTEPYTMVDSCIAVLSSAGNSVLKFGSAVSGTYYIVLKHRNSIETWSKSGGIALTRGSSSSYNFTSSSGQAFGNNLNLKGTKYCIFNGDINQDGIIDAVDLSLADNDAFNFVTGYVNTDVNGNNVVDVNDLAIIDNNVYNFVSKITPP